MLPAMTMKAATTLGRVSSGNTKMPGTVYSSDPFRCKVGEKLATVEGSVCSKCYARRLATFRTSVRQGWAANLDKFRAADADAWSQAIAFQILKAGTAYHRWFDAGDLDGIDQLRAIVAVCQMTPKVRHWLPTREAGVVKAYLKEAGAFPANLVIRVSSTMIGDGPRNFPHTSTVHRKGETFAGSPCESASRGNQCGDCRACWSSDVPNVSYPLH